MKQPVNVRIDERLIHGQVAHLWSKALQVTRIVLIDDQVIHNAMQKTLQKSACPEKIKLSIISAERAAENFKVNKYADEEVMVVVRWPETLKQLSDLGIAFDEVTIGNMPNKPNTKTITNQIYVNDKQIEIFKSLSKSTNFIVQLVPDSAKENFIKMLD